jgi:hypothetical protein
MRDAARSTTMQTMVEETFVERTVFIDAIRFERCRFIRCQLFYRASEPAVFDDCHIDQCDWVFDDAAKHMLAFLSSLYRTTTGEGHSLVESVFEGIKDGRLGSDVVTVRAPVPA